MNLVEQMADAVEGNEDALGNVIVAAVRSKLITHVEADALGDKYGISWKSWDFTEAEELLKS